MTDKIISLHIKVYKSNFFFIVSNRSGQVLFINNSGSLGFRNIQKRSVEALMSLLEVSLKKIILLKKQFLFLKLEGIKLSDSKLIYKYLIMSCKKNNIVLIGLKHVNKIVHNGCRVPK